MLPEIIETPDGLTMLTEEDKTVKEAYRDLGKGKKYSVFDQIEQCAEAIEDAPWRDLVDLPTNRSKQRKLRRLEKALIALKERTGDSDPAAIA